MSFAYTTKMGDLRRLLHRSIEIPSVPGVMTHQCLTLDVSARHWLAGYHNAANTNQRFAIKADGYWEKTDRDVHHREDGALAGRAARCGVYSCAHTRSVYKCVDLYNT